MCAYVSVCTDPCIQCAGVSFTLYICSRARWVCCVDVFISENVIGGSKMRLDSSQHAGSHLGNPCSGLPDQTTVMRTEELVQVFAVGWPRNAWRGSKLEGAEGR